MPKNTKGVLMQSIAENVATIRAGIRAALRESGRAEDDCLLVAVSKTQPAAAILEALDCGIRDFGENKVQEAASKLPELLQQMPEGFKPPNFHFIGHLQTNKVKALLRLQPQLIQSVDSFNLAQTISRQLTHPQDILIQVNTSGEGSKSGMTPSTAWDEIHRIAALPHLMIKGLMTIGLLADDPEDARPGFRALKQLFEKLRAENDPGIEMKYLSMGMTDDYRIAIHEGANLVRVGSAIFGKRERGTL